MKKLFKSMVVKILEFLARLSLWRYKPLVVAVTGSVGKTSTKDAIATVLSRQYTVRASQKSFNSEFGVPLTILGQDTGWGSPGRWIKVIAKAVWCLLTTRAYPEVLVLEVGADRPGDIRKITDWLRPDITVVTQMSNRPVHIEFFSSVDELIREKKYLVEQTADNGLVILNRDDKHEPIFTAAAPTRPFYIGYREPADLFGSNYQIYYDPNGRPQGISLKLNHRGSSVPVNLSGVVGRQLIYPVLIAAAVGIRQGMNLVDISQALNDHQLPPGRMRVLPGRDRITLIDDSYNASPIAVERALDTLEELSVPGRKVLVLGDMRELGEYCEEAHRQAGQRAAEVGDYLIAIGEYADFILTGAQTGGLESGQFKQFATVRECVDKIESLLQVEDTILIKGSQSVRLEVLVRYLLAEGLEPEELLVRQDREWEKKTKGVT